MTQAPLVAPQKGELMKAPRNYCPTCRWWSLQEQHPHDDDTFGTCHAKAPYLLGSESTDIGVFPITYKDAWCGDWRADGPCGSLRDTNAWYALSVRARNTLDRMNVATVERAIMLNRKEFSGIRNCGAATMGELMEFIEVLKGNASKENSETT